MSFTCKLFHPDGLNFALLWEPSPCFRLPSILLRGEIQGDKIRLLLFIRSIPGYCQFYGTWKYSNLQRKGLSVDFPIMCIYLKRKASGEKLKKKKSHTSQTESRSVLCTVQALFWFHSFGRDTHDACCLNNYLLLITDATIYSMKWALNNPLFETEQLS